jgi:phosphatidylserine decarboxylase
MLKKLKNFFLLAMQYLLPQQLISKAVGKLAHSQHKTLKRFLIRQFIQYFHVDMTESIRREDDFLHFNAFFTRRLKPELRPIDAASDVLVSPCDGTVLEYGPLTQASVLQAKGHPFHLSALLGDSSHHDLSALAQGSYATFYLSPKDYHRVHMPYAGKLERTTYIPGRLFSVNPLILRHVPQVFSRNERLVCHFSTDQGPMVVIFVGAMIVSGIRTVWRANSKLFSKNMMLGNYASRQLNFEKGQEIGHFELGSTVIVLFPWKGLHWDLKIGQEMRMGEKIASIGT